ncbi:MAG: NADH-quinone oxidoreductase subunit L [Paludibacteraceae bacterium]|nr:NADH-quinone oxidoreductase subunit L [Paludibacteraceae bacterium]MBQ3896331.1 NADH-quinone oxidoreductase subunit L [Paludibacteraceae bacterium]MBR0498467.1 NADH-quinone oxidoreductase subunit L [Paludibacteraceae bacterium]MBR6803366.1 NADH-quinone oxidoreductase subunit L [Paludibacteraceae bacterium]
MDTNLLIALIILLIPAFNFLLLGLCGVKMSHKTAGVIGTTGLGIVTILSYVSAFNYFLGYGKVDGVYKALSGSFQWLSFSDTLHIDLGLYLDPISVMMLVVISTVSFMVHLYSNGYMHGERGFQRYYAFLSLFTFSMLGLVVATNIFQMYIFWELVGVSSYLLIGFYYTKASAVLAAKKAFIVTRFADLGMLLGILVLSFYTDTFDFDTLNSTGFQESLKSVGATFMGASVFTWATALIFIGGAGKSAMLPLHIWLPDAMEGPTPVSALIHAATMVVAGVYLVARLFPFYFNMTPEVLTGIAYIGALTSLYAAVVACAQTDIKRVLAFSTISQIAYMMVALGVSKLGGHDGLGYMASMFHLFTHAFFKACLFLCAGAVIHTIGSNEMDKMGSLRKYMPITHITFLIACLAIAGIPPFSGFFSKDEILVAAFEEDKVLFFCQWFVAGLTAFYMFRLYYGIFWGENKNYGEHTPHEAPLNMTLPLIILAALTCFTGFLPFSELVTSDGKAFEIHTEWIVAIPSVLVGVIGIAVATLMYKNKSTVPDKITSSIKGFYVAAKNRFYFDEVYMFVTKKIIFKAICGPIAWFDRHIIDGFMDFQAWWSNALSFRIRGLQSGSLQTYIGVFITSILVISAIIIAYVLI